MLAVPALIYALLCVLVAFRGRRSHLGFVGTLLLSIFLTPVIVYGGLLVFNPPYDAAEIVYESRRGERR